MGGKGPTMEDNRIFRSFNCSVWGPLSKWLKGAVKIFSSHKVWMMEKSWVSNVHGWSGSESWNILCAHCTLYILWFDSGSTKSLLKLTSQPFILFGWFYFGFVQQQFHSFTTKKRCLIILHVQQLSCRRTEKKLYGMDKRSSSIITPFPACWS